MNTAVHASNDKAAVHASKACSARHGLVTDAWRFQYSYHKSQQLNICGHPWPCVCLLLVADCRLLATMCADRCYPLRSGSANQRLKADMIRFVALHH